MLSVRVENTVIKKKRANSALLTGRFIQQTKEEIEQKQEKMSFLAEHHKSKILVSKSKHSLPLISESSLKCDSDEVASQKSAGEDIQKWPVEYSNVWEVFKDVCKREGIQGLYKGITPLLIGNFISYGVYFFWYTDRRKNKDFFEIFSKV